MSTIEVGRRKFTSRPREEDRTTRKPLPWWDRVKFLVLLAALFALSRVDGDRRQPDPAGERGDQQHAAQPRGGSGCSRSSSCSARSTS